MAKKTKVFIACDIPDLVRKKCAQVQSQLTEELPMVRWVKPEHMHITLVFLGEIRDQQLWEACSMTKKAASVFSEFSFSLKGLGCFPNPRRPRVLWMGVDEKSAPKFSQLHEQISSAISLSGWFREENKGFSAHLTLGRLNQDVDLSVQCSKWKTEVWTTDECPVREIQVYSSEMTADGPEYTKLSKVALKKN